MRDDILSLVRTAEQAGLDPVGPAYNRTPAGAPDALVIPAQGADGSIFAVLVIVDGGDAGDRTNPCTYTYTVKDLAADIYNKNRDLTGDPATGMTPTKQRPPWGMMTAPAEGSYGAAVYDGNALVLLDAFETETPED